ncbi:MAG: hypothetical protein AAFY57_04640 [Cyanobacteria bacterium J06642_2]
MVKSSALWRSLKIAKNLQDSDRAPVVLEQILAIANETGDEEFQKRMAKAVSDVYVRLGDSDRAIAIREQL